MFGKPRSVIGAAAFTATYLAAAVSGSPAAADCGIQEIRGGVAACADANTIDLRDREMPGIGPPCDTREGGECTAAAQRLRDADFGFLDGGGQRRGILQDWKPLGFSAFHAAGNIAFREFDGTPPGGRAHGYGHWSVLRLTSLTGKLVAEQRALTIVEARRDGARYTITRPVARRASLRETRDLASGQVYRRVWGRDKSERLAMRLHWISGRPGYGAVAWSEDARGRSERHFDASGRLMAGSDTGDVLSPDAAFAAVQARLALAALKAALSRKVQVPSPIAVAGSYQAFVALGPATMPAGPMRTAIGHLDAGDDASATALLLAAITGMPPDPLPELLLGLMYLGEASHVAAEAALFKAWRKDKTCWRCLLARAVVLERLGRTVPADHHYRLAAARAPAEPTLGYYLARQALQGGDVVQARRHLNVLFATQPPQK